MPLKSERFTAILVADGDDLIAPIPEDLVKRLGLAASSTVHVTLALTDG